MTTSGGSDHPDAVVRRINLVEVLLDAQPGCPEPPDDAPVLWSEAQIRSYFKSNGRDVPPTNTGVGSGALDINGEPLPPPTRADGRYLCQRVGCSAVYSPDANPEGGCRYHAGAPVFHDGSKKWGCCGAKSHDFATFMELPGCETGRHTQQKPPKSAPSLNIPVAPPIPLSVEARTKAAAAPAAAAGVSASTTPDDCPRCRQGFFCSDHAQSAEAQAAYVTPKPKPKQSAKIADPADPHADQTCRNKGCGEKFTEATNADQACTFHPGPPIFHERQKGWSCCNKICYDFDEFMNIPPCAKGRHNANPEEHAYAKKAPKK